MLNAHLNQEHSYLLTLEDSLSLQISKLKNLQQFWIPLQEQAPNLVLALWLIGISVSLATQLNFHFFIIAPLICVLIIVEIVIEEAHLTLLLTADKKRHLLDIAAGNTPVTQRLT